MILFRFVLTVLAILLIFFGIIAMISPIPFGILMIALGMVLLAMVAPKLVRSMRQRWRWLDRMLDDATPRLPKWLARRLKESDPPDDEDSAPDKSEPPNDEPPGKADHASPDIHSGNPPADERAARARHILTGTRNR